MRLEKRLKQLEQITADNDVDISPENWLKSISEQKKECQKQGITITPIKWVTS